MTKDLDDELQIINEEIESLRETLPDSSEKELVIKCLQSEAAQIIRNKTNLTLQPLRNTHDQIVAEAKQLIKKCGDES